MNNDLLKNLKDDFMKEKDENDIAERQLNSLLERKRLLENTRIVQDYLELCDQVDAMSDKVQDEKQIFLRTLFDYEHNGLVDETNDIFLYAGSYVTDLGYTVPVERDDPDAEFDNYINIESLEELDIPTEDREDFETEHKVIVLNGRDYDNCNLYDLHTKFMYDAMLNGQEKACQRVLKK